MIRSVTCSVKSHSPNTTTPEGRFSATLVIVITHKDDEPSTTTVRAHGPGPREALANAFAKLAHLATESAYIQIGCDE